MKSAAVEASSEAPVAVPFLDLEPTLRHGIREAVLADIEELLRTHAYTNGPHVAAFERAFAAYCGTDECIGVSNGLDGLRLALIAAGIEAGDEVVVPANTFVATVEAVAQAGGVPVLADAGESDFNLDVDAAAAAIGPRTRFLLPVHLYGQLADVAGLEQIAQGAGIQIVEDACQAHGARRDGRLAGSVGVAAAFSFYPGKNLGAIGDAGAVVTGDGELARAVRTLREHGQSRKYEHDVEGWTARLDTIQALLLLHKLPHLDGWNEERHAAARFYSEALADVGDLRLPPVAEASEPVWHLYVVRTARPAALAEFLAARGIGTGRHYPQPVHLTSAYRRLGYPRGAFPVAEALADELLSLPIYPGISELQLSAVVEAVGDYFRRG